MSTAWPTALRVLPVTNADTDGSTVVVADRLVPPTPMLSDAASSNRSVEIVGVDAADTMILPLLAVTCEPLTEAETPPPAVLSDVRSPIEKPKAEIVIVTWVISAVMSVVSCAVTETSRAAVTLLAPEINALVVASTSLTAVMLPVAAAIAAALMSRPSGTGNGFDRIVPDDSARRATSSPVERTRELSMPAVVIVAIVFLAVTSP